MAKLMLDFLDLIEREEKPRKCGLTAIVDKGLGPTQLTAALEASAPYIDYLKLNTYSFRLYPEDMVKAKIDLCHQNQIKMILGGNVGELAWLQGNWEKLTEEGRKFGWDVFEISETYVNLTDKEKAYMVTHCADMGYEVIYEWGLKHPTVPLDPNQAADDVLKLLEQNIQFIILEEGEVDMLLGKDGSAPHGDRLASFFEKVGIENIMVEAVQLRQLSWLMKNFGASVNIGPNTSFEQLMSLEPMRRGIGRGVDYVHYDKFLNK